MIFLLGLIAYLLGSVSFGIVTGYIVSGEDIRTKGSGNAGATNVFRILGWKRALPVLAADFLKGFLPVYFTPWFLTALSVEHVPVSLIQIEVLFFILLGHAFPLFFRFKGGKGAASAAGGVSALFPPAIPFCLFIFLVVIFSSKYVSLASIITVWVLPFYYCVYTGFIGSVIDVNMAVFFFLVAILITFLHRKNIKRLVNKEETKIKNWRK